MASFSVFGEKLMVCNTNPITGFYRDRWCQTGDEVSGTHKVCALLTSEFLEFSRSMGNGLKTPIPDFGFPGLKEGNHLIPCDL